MFSKLSQQTKSRIFVLSGNKNLSLVNRDFHDISSIDSVKANFILNTHKKCSSKIELETLFRRYPKIMNNEDVVIKLVKKGSFFKKMNHFLFMYAIEKGWVNLISIQLTLFVKKIVSIYSESTTEDPSKNNQLENRNYFKHPLIRINQYNGAALNLAIVKNRIDIIRVMQEAYKIRPQNNFHQNETHKLSGHEELDFDYIKAESIFQLENNSSLEMLGFLLGHSKARSAMHRVLFKAINHNRLDTFKNMIDLGFKIRDPKVSVAIRCCYAGRAEMLNHLHFKGFDISDCDDSVLKYSIVKGHDSVVQTLLEKGLQLKTFDQNYLEIASKYCSLETLEKLWKKGARFSGSGVEAMINACKRSEIKIIRFLVSKGIDIDVFDNFPLINACVDKSIDIVKFLVFCGADVNARNGEPLFKATQSGCIDIVHFLLAYGADPTIDCMKSLKYAQDNGMQDICRLISESITAQVPNDFSDISKWIEANEF
ncbi:putative ankyrin repeat protein [Smittium mucronatum]|uniref:Putative ankyrin repeat protein n=1 Tax=Smittium mucronatum TaxID=133383 RepID=A0A1R0H010_9FUNG|nr:putative ankyrin repeat protein [Smittium mucronatum]